MDKHYKEIWLQALRSGKYRQTKGVLHKYKGGFCCLGVLCDALGEKWEDPVEISTTIDGGNSSRNIKVKCYGIRSPHGSFQRLVLPQHVMKKVGLNSSYAAQNDLTALNDGGKKFSTIANWIEKNL